MNHQGLLSIIALPLLANAAFGGPAGTTHYPDVQTLPPSDFGVQYNASTGQKLVRFTATIANLGAGPLDVAPVNNATSGTTDAYQRLYSHDANGNWYLVSSNYVGTFVFHPEHNHWHFEDFARYQLHDLAADGSVGPNVLASNSKVSFCIRDDIPANSALEHSAAAAAYVNCDQIDPQGISVGWADVYDWTLEGQSLDVTGFPDGDYWLVIMTDPDNRLNEGGGAEESNNTGLLKVHLTSDIVWVEDAVPAGAVTGAYSGDSWKWIGSNPTPFSGSLAHQSAIVKGTHQHFFYGATATLSVNTGNVLFAYIYLDPANIPSEVMLQWSDGSWEHRAYWGANLIMNGTDGTASRRRIGPLPSAGQWVRLEVPASQVALEGSTLNGMSFTLYGGRAAWDYTGVNVAPASQPPPPPADTTPPVVAISAPANNATVSGTISVLANASDNVGVAGVRFKLDGTLLGAEVTASPYQVNWDTAGTPNGSHTLTALARDADGNQTTSSPVSVTVSNIAAVPPSIWVEDAVPAGSRTGGYGGDGWNWVSSNPAPFSGNLAHQSAVASGPHQHFFYGANATLKVNAGDVLFTYVYLDPANTPSELMLQWSNSNWEHRAYWGANLIGNGTDGTASRRFMGPLPPVGQWVRLEVPASQVGLEGATLTGMSFTLYGGRATWDYTGK